MFASLNSRLYTVASLREIAERMNLTLPAKATKPVIAQTIADAIESIRDEAIAEYDRRVEIAHNMIESERAVTALRDKLAGYGPLCADETSRLIDGYYERMRNRLDHYTRQNGTNRLTARQARRYNKKTAKQGKRLSA